MTADARASLLIFPQNWQTHMLRRSSTLVQGHRVAVLDDFRLSNTGTKQNFAAPKSNQLGLVKEVLFTCFLDKISIQSQKHRQQSVYQPRCISLHDKWIKQLGYNVHQSRYTMSYCNISTYCASRTYADVSTVTTIYMLIAAQSAKYVFPKILFLNSFRFRFPGRSLNAFYQSYFIRGFCCQLGFWKCQNTRTQICEYQAKLNSYKSSYRIRLKY